MRYLMFICLLLYSFVECYCQSNFSFSLKYGTFKVLYNDSLISLPEYKWKIDNNVLYRLLISPQRKEVSFQKYTNEAGVTKFTELGYSVKDFPVTTISGYDVDFNSKIIVFCGSTDNTQCSLYALQLDNPQSMERICQLDAQCSEITSKNGMVYILDIGGKLSRLEISDTSRQLKINTQYDIYERHIAGQFLIKNGRDKSYITKLTEGTELLLDGYIQSLKIIGHSDNIALLKEEFDDKSHLPKAFSIFLTDFSNNGVVPLLDITNSSLDTLYLEGYFFSKMEKVYIVVHKMTNELWQVHRIYEVDLKQKIYNVVAVGNDEYIIELPEF